MQFVFPKRNSLLDHLCANSPKTGRFSIFKLLIINNLTRWRWTESAANRSLDQFPANREEYREICEFNP
jgi:hypothetical protein